MADEDYEMGEQEAKAYLERKGKPVNKESIEKIRRSGKIYGDPIFQTADF